MSGEVLFFSVKTIGLSTRMKRKPQTLLHAVKHNLREDQKERGSRSHIDPARSHLNQRIAGPALSADVVALALARMAGAGYKPLRHDYTQAYEALFSLPAGTSIDTNVYFRRCLSWAVDQFGLDNILSAGVHHDEAAPHLHILVLPMAGTRYMGSKLIDRVRLANLRESFAELALAFGLKEPTRRLHGAMKEATARMVLAHLETTQDAILQSAMWFTAKQDIERNPARYAAALGLVLPELAAPIKKIKTFRDIALSTGKGPKLERPDKPIGFGGGAWMARADDVVKPIGFKSDREDDPKNIETIPVLVSAQKPLSPLSARPPPARPPQAPRPAPRPAPELPEPQFENGVEVETTRVRDSDRDTAMYDLDTGEYFRPPAPARHARQAADAWVKSAVMARTACAAAG